MTLEGKMRKSQQERKKKKKYKRLKYVPGTNADSVALD